MLGLSRMEPVWSSSLAGVLHSICFDAAESADVATCVALLQELLLHLRQVHTHCKAHNSTVRWMSLSIVNLSPHPPTCCLTVQS